MLFLDRNVIPLPTLASTRELAAELATKIQRPDQFDHKEIAHLYDQLSKLDDWGLLGHAKDHFDTACIAYARAPYSPETYRLIISAALTAPSRSSLLEKLDIKSTSAPILNTQQVMAEKWREALGEFFFRSFCSEYFSDQTLNRAIPFFMRVDPETSDIYNISNTKSVFSIFHVGGMTLVFTYRPQDGVLCYNDSSQDPKLPANIRRIISLINNQPLLWEGEKIPRTSSDVITLDQEAIKKIYDLNFQYAQKTLNDIFHPKFRHPRPHVKIGHSGQNTCEGNFWISVAVNGRFCGFRYTPSHSGNSFHGIGWFHRGDWVKVGYKIYQDPKTEKIIRVPDIFIPQSPLNNFQKIALSRYQQDCERALPENPVLLGYSPQRTLNILKGAKE